MAWSISAGIEKNLLDIRIRHGLLIFRRIEVGTRLAFEKEAVSDGEVPESRTTSALDALLSPEEVRSQGFYERSSAAPVISRDMAKLPDLRPFDKALAKLFELSLSLSISDRSSDNKPYVQGF
jgi:hypothetical protein